MTISPDTSVFTSPDFAALSIGGALVTVNGVQTTVGALLALGASGTLLVAGITSNASGALGLLPPSGYILRLLLHETAGHQVAVTVGTTSGGGDVAPVSGSSIVPAFGTLTIDVTNLINWFSATAAQALFLASASWGGASISAKLDFEVGP